MDVYLLDLNTLRGRENAALGLLSPDRREKVLRLRRELPRLQSIGAGLLLRHVFGPRAPERTEAGKPYFPGERRFSLSHSARRAVLAVDRAETGVDIQVFVTPPEALQRRVLTDAERAWLSGADEAGFAWLWSRKEAVFKCLGTGADRSMRSFSVLPGEMPAMDGRVFALHSVLTDGYALSAASMGGSADFTLREVSAEDLTGTEVE